MLALDGKGIRVDGDELRLRMPAAGPYTRLARVAVTGLATRLGFSIDEVEDLRVAVADVCTRLIAIVPEAEHLDVTFVVGDANLVIDVGVDGTDASGHRVELDELTADLRDASVDELAYLEDRDVIRVAKAHSDD